MRLIRSDLKLDVFGKQSSVPPELILEHTVTTIDIKEQRLKKILSKTTQRDLTTTELISQHFWETKSFKIYILGSFLYEKEKNLTADFEYRK